jgi:hypothetical protein
VVADVVSIEMESPDDDITPPMERNVSLTQCRQLTETTDAGQMWQQNALMEEFITSSPIDVGGPPPVVSVEEMARNNEA